jgi:hypothetical protein
MLKYKSTGNVLLIKERTHLKNSCCIKVNNLISEYNAITIKNDD